MLIQLIMNVYIFIVNNFASNEWNSVGFMTYKEESSKLRDVEG